MSRRDFAVMSVIVAFGRTRHARETSHPHRCRESHRLLLVVIELAPAAACASSGGRAAIRLGIREGASTGRGAARDTRRCTWESPGYLRGNGVRRFVTTYALVGGGKARALDVISRCYHLHRLHTLAERQRSGRFRLGFDRGSTGRSCERSEHPAHLHLGPAHHHISCQPEPAPPMRASAVVGSSASRIEGQRHSASAIIARWHMLPDISCGEAPGAGPATDLATSSSVEYARPRGPAGHASCRMIRPRDLRADRADRIQRPECGAAPNLAPRGDHAPSMSVMFRVPG